MRWKSQCFADEKNVCLLASLTPSPPYTVAPCELQWVSTTLMVKLVCVSPGSWFKIETIMSLAR